VSTPLIYQYVELLRLYRDLDLAMQCHPDVGEHNKVEFARGYIRGKISDDNSVWLTPYLHQQLSFKKKGFFSYMLSDYDRMLRAAFILSELKDEADVYRFDRLVGALNGKVVTAFPDDDEHSAVKAEPKLYLQRGLFSVSEHELTRLKANNKLAPGQKVNITVIAQNPTTYHLVLESLACFGWVFTPPKFVRGEKLVFALTIDHNCDKLRWMESVGIGQRSRYQKLQLKD